MIVRRYRIESFLRLRLLEVFQHRLVVRITLVRIVNSHNIRDTIQAPPLEQGFCAAIMDAASQVIPFGLRDIMDEFVE